MPRRKRRSRSTSRRSRSTSQQPSPSTTLVFVATEIDRTRRFTKRLLEKAGVRDGVRRPRPEHDAGRAARWRAGVAAVTCKTNCSAPGARSSRAARQMLVDRAGGDISKLRGDVERLLLYAGEPQEHHADDVMEVRRPSTERRGRLGGRQRDRATAMSRGRCAKPARRLERGDSPHALVGQLRWWVSHAAGGSRAATREAGARRAAADGPGAQELRRRRPDAASSGWSWN